MKNRSLSKLLIGLTAAISLAACNNGSSSSSSSPATSPELGVAAISVGASVAESALWISQTPSSGIWSSYMSGTTNQIIAMAANSSNVLAFDGANLLLSSNQDGQFMRIPFSGGSLSSANIVAGSNDFILYTNSQIWVISNTGSVTAVTSSASAAGISSIENFGGVFYAYTNANTVYTSPDGLTWSAATGQNIQAFTKVVQLNTGLYAAMTAPVGSNPNVWLGTSPTSFNSTNLNNFFNVPAQVNFIASSGNGDLYFNETVSATNRTIRLYKIADASQVNTGPIITTYEIPGTSDTVKPTNIFITPTTVYIPTGTTTTAGGNQIDPNGATTLTATSNILTPNAVTQLVGSQNQTNGSVYTIQESGLLVAAVGAGSNNGDLTLITNASNPAIPSYQVLPSGSDATYARVIGNTTNFMLLLNNGGVLLSNGSGFVPSNAIINNSDSSGSLAITGILSAAAVNNTYLVQATSADNSPNGDLYFNDNGSSWGMVTQAQLTAANLGTLTESAVTLSSITGLYNITTVVNSTTKTYQTAVPTNLATWVAAPSPTPLLSINGGIFTLYPNSTSIGTLSGSQYTVLTNALPQNYVSTGNVAMNESGLIALAQTATVVPGVKTAGSNYIWTASTSSSGWMTADNWTLNTATFSGLNGTPILSENFNANPILLWTGKIWVTYGNGELLVNDGVPPTVYTSNNTISWQAAGESVPVMGTPFLF